jgi:amino acid adenylation domain-containing protein
MLKILSRSVGEHLQYTTEKFMGNIALKDSHGAYTYRELMQVSDQICFALQGNGLKRGDVVALFFHQSKEAIAAALGVLKAGCCFVPMDVSDPVARLRFINQDCTPAALLIGESNEELVTQVANHQQVIINFEQHEHAERNQVATQSVSPEALAYIFYTSGSTGKPKGVCQSHQNLLHFANVYGNTLNLHNQDILSMLYSLNFSASNMDVFAGLMNGATVNLYNLKEKGTGELGEWLDHEQITILHTIPTVLRYLMNDSVERHIYTYVRAVDLGGEPVYSSDIGKLQRCFSPKCRIVNHYAATEASVIAQHEIDMEYEYKTGILPVGKPAQGVQVTVTAENGEPAATNEVGQITIFSPFLSPGYWNRPELTEKGFIEVNEKVSVRGYHSGDLGFLDKNGNLNYLGRSDCRVKIRGFRIELGEIESALNRHPKVQDAVVVSFDTLSGEKQLAAYVVTNPNLASASSAELRSFLNQTLPTYMIPSVVIHCHSFPLTPNGKVDRHRLPAPHSEKDQGAYAKPRNAVEEVLLGMMSELLGCEELGIHSDFFQLGGHSLLATKLMTQIQEAFRLQVPLQQLFTTPTVCGLSQAMEKIEGDANTLEETARLLLELIQLSDLEVKEKLK